MSTFSGFSEEELKRIKSGETGPANSNSVPKINAANVRKVDKLGFKQKRPTNQYKLPILQKQNSDEAIDNIDFQKCKLSLRSPSTPPNHEISNENNKENVEIESNNGREATENSIVAKTEETNNKMGTQSTDTNNQESPAGDRKNSTVLTPEAVKAVEINYSEDELINHKMKLEELQLRQKLMEEQNKKRKEMLAKALADRTKQTAEEVVRLEKIKKELQVLDSQFSQDVAVLRAKIDQACLSYAEAEKHYLRVEKEFLQAKIHLQKEKEKKELLTEHLCALITHNETRKAQKLETLMLELATDKKNELSEVAPTVDEEKPEIVDGVDERTGKIVELTPQS